MAIGKTGSQNQIAFQQLRDASKQIQDDGVRQQFDKAVDSLESRVDKVDIDNVIGGLLNGGFSAAGQIGRTGMAVGIGAGLGTLAWDQGKAGIDSVVNMVNEFSADQAARGTGDALLLTLPDAAEAVIHVALAGFLAAGVAKTAQAWINLTFDQASTKAAE